MAEQIDLDSVPDNQYLSTSALSAITSISESTLEQWRLRREGFPFVKIGRCVRYRAADVKEHLRLSRVETRHERNS